MHSFEFTSDIWELLNDEAKAQLIGAAKLLGREGAKNNMLKMEENFLKQDRPIKTESEREYIERIKRKRSISGG